MKPPLRVRAAVDAAHETAAEAYGSIDHALVIVARTDALKTHGLDEALERARLSRGGRRRVFRRGADVRRADADDLRERSTGPRWPTA